MKSIESDIRFVLVMALARRDAQCEGFDQVGLFLILHAFLVATWCARLLFLVCNDWRSDGRWWDDRLVFGLDRFQRLGHEFERQRAAADEGVGSV